MKPSPCRSAPMCGRVVGTLTHAFYPWTPFAEMHIDVYVPTPWIPFAWSELELRWRPWFYEQTTHCWDVQHIGVATHSSCLSIIVMVASYLSSPYLISASILSNLGAHLISYLIYGCGLVSSSRTFWYVPLHSDVIDDITWPALEYMR